MSDLLFREKLAVEWGIKDSYYRLSNDVVDKQKSDIEDINESCRRYKDLNWI